MALIKCEECGKEISDKAGNCVNCGVPIAKESQEDNSYEQLSDYTTYKKSMFSIECFVCRTKSMECYSVKHGNICKKCYEVCESNGMSIFNIKKHSPEVIIDLVSKHHSKLAKNQEDGVACCNKCGSTSLSANKKGFGIGKAVVGAALTGGIGLMAGNIGAKKVRVTCMVCGNEFMAGSQ